LGSASGSVVRVVPPLHAVTDGAVVARPDFLSRAAELIAALGARLAFHLRAPGAAGRVMYELAAALAPRAAAAGALLLVNDRVDVALASGAGGAQIGAHGIPLADVRHLLAPHHVLGASVHSRAGADDAVRAGADFLLVGTVFRSRSHPDRDGSGVQVLRELAGLGTPLIAIGGVTPERVREVRRTGASGVAALSGIWDAAEPVAAAFAYLHEWSDVDEERYGNHG
jgi:thiamine-phosphate diphosphorylase